MSFSSRIDAHYARLKANKDYLDRVKYCKDNQELCNDWEIDFLDSIYTRLLGGGSLTARQEDKLGDIEFIVAGGDRESTDDL